MTEPQQTDEYCPHCGVAYEPTQEYCLECGARLPVNRGVVGVLARSWQRRFAWYPGDWIWPTFLFLLLTIAATGVALAANSARNSSRPYVATSLSVPVGPGATPTRIPATSAPATLPVPTAQPTITSGPLPQPPGTATGTGAIPTTSTPAQNRNGLVSWPTNKSGYTLVLESLPVSGGKAAALARARRARQNGLPDVGVLTSADYSSLHAGYYVVFSGIYSAASEAEAALGNAHAKGFPDAFERQVTR